MLFPKKTKYKKQFNTTDTRRCFKFIKMIFNIMF